MSSLQFDFLDLSEIEEEDYIILISILEEKKEEVLIPSLEGSPVKDLKDEGDDDKAEKNELDFISQTIRDESAVGISFFVDGGTAEDIDPRDTPPILSSSVTPPQSDSPSTLCNDQEELLPDDEPVNMYHQPAPQTQYINQHPALVQPMNVHSVPTSGIYNIPAYPPHSGPGGVHGQVYPHMPPPPNHAHQMVPPTVHIENCHVNVSPSPYGNPHTAPHGALYATPPPPPHHYQGAPQHPQMFQPYMLPEQQPSMPMPIKNMEKDFDHKRHDTHNRGNFRGRGRGRGRRRGREDHERSNSVSSDHSSYSDSGGKSHYKDNAGPTTPTLQPSLQYSQIMQYAPYMPYAVTTMPRTQGFPMIPHFIGPYPGDHQGHHVLAYQTQPPPATVALVSNENTSNHAQQQLIMPHSTVQEQQQMITGHPEYIVASSYEATNTMDTINYSYPCIEECNSAVEPVDPNIPLSTPATESLPNNSNINIVVTCSSNTFIVNDDVDIEKGTVKNDDPVEYVENKVSNIKIDKDETSVCSNLNLGKSVSQSVKIEEVEIENKDTCPEAQVEIDNSAPMTQPIKSSRSSRTKSVTIGKGTEKKVQPKTPSSQRSTKAPDQISVLNADIELSADLNEKTSPPVVQQKGKENGAPSKPKLKSSSNNNTNPLKTKVTDPLLLDSVSDLSFGLDTSITVYNQALAPILQPKDFVNSKVTKIEKSKPSSSPATLVNTPFVIPETKPDELVATKPPIKVAFEEPLKPKPVVELPSENNATASKPVEPAWGQKKSWSQLFKPNDDFSTKQIAFVSPFNAKENENASLKLASQKESVDLNISDNEMDKVKVGTLIKKYIPDYRPIHLQPKGLINKNYWCYVNAPLQALLACPSFYRLAKTLSKEAGYKSGNFSTPFINSLVDFVSEFNPMAPLTKQNRKEKNKKEPEIITGVPFEPTCVYKTLCNLKKDQFTEGRQQDAEEMLSCVLNGLHDEMVESLKLAGGLDVTQNGTVEQDLKNDDQNEWKVQGPKKKSYVTRTAHFSPSPISQIFWGQLRSVLQQAGGNTTANLQPFNTLPLDIQSPKVDTLKDALSQLVTREEISGFTCPKTNQEVTASNQVMFEDLPRVLILQLKRFIYDNGGLQKVTKRLQFPIDLEITKDLLSTNSRGRFSASQRKYRLFAIVNHEGKEANKGHYVADVFHNGYNCWLRYDDSNVKSIPETTVLRHDPPKVPYLLFYRRSDTLSPPSSQHVNGNSAGGSSNSSSSSNGGGGGSSNSSVSSTCNGKN
ncbi:UNVERIFIED_CONTAM: hypothetical protein RMT77_013474 [Armadillidium vulgare]